MRRDDGHDGGLEEPTPCPWCRDVVELELMRRLGRHLVCRACHEEHSAGDEDE